MNLNFFKKWLMDKAINIIVVICFLLFVIFIIFVAGISSSFKGYNVNTRALSNKKIEWGIKRNNNHQQPDLGQKNYEILNEFDGYVIGSKEKKYIYLTFDVGYDNGYMGKILDTLRENDVKAAFFITGQFVKTSSDTLKKMIEEGHIIGNHTVNHKSLPNCTEEVIEQEVMNLHKKIYEEFNYEMKYMRPPKGEYSEKSLAYIQKLGYIPVMWSFAYDDWDEQKQGREEYGKKKILDNLHNGEIMLLHATSKDNANILDEIIKKAKEEGYQFKSLDEFEKN